MSSTPKRISVPLAIVLALAITPALAGCFANPVQQIIEGATGGQVDLGGTSVPADFPSEIPLASGEIVYGASVAGADGQVWNVTVRVPGVEALNAIVSQLEGAGFTATEGFGGSTADGGTAALTSSKYGVLIVVGSDGQNGFVANYTVTTQAAQ